MKDKISIIKITKLKKGKKKYMIQFKKGNKTITRKFGSKGMSDFTIHKDKKRRDRYIKRHKKDLRTNDPTRAGFLSMYILWNKKTFKASLLDYKKRLNKYNKTGKFPKKITGSILKFGDVKSVKNGLSKYNKTGSILKFGDVKSFKNRLVDFIILELNITKQELIKNKYPDNIIELMYPNNNFGYILNIIVERIDYLKSNNENNINEEIKILKQLIKQYNENYDNASAELGYMYLLQDVDEHTQNEILEQIAEIETQAYFDELDLN